MWLRRTPSPAYKKGRNGLFERDYRTRVVAQSLQETKLYVTRRGSLADGDDGAEAFESRRGAVRNKLSSQAHKEVKRNEK